jgi:hypothetical protein
LTAVDYLAGIAWPFSDKRYKTKDRGSLTSGLLFWCWAENQRQVSNWFSFSVILLRFVRSRRRGRGEAPATNLPALCHKTIARQTELFENFN